MGGWFSPESLDRRPHKFFSGCALQFCCAALVSVFCDSELRADIKRTALQDSGISQELLVSG